LWADILKTIRKLVLDEGKNAPGNADAARRGYSFQPSRDVDTVAIEVVGIDENIADIDADAEIHSAAFVRLSIADAQFLLDRNCTAHRFYRLAEFSEYAISGGVEDATIVARDQSIDHRAVGF